MDVIRPFADLEGIFQALHYRSTQTKPFESLDIDGNSATFVVRVDDLRTIPQHQFQIQLNSDALKPHYVRHQEDLVLTIIVRDTILRRELLVGTFSLDSIPSTIDLDRNALRTTSLRDAMTIDFAIVLRKRNERNIAFPIQSASRLAELQIVIKNTAGGPSFPYKRVSGDDWKQKGLPSESGIHLELFCDPQELVGDVDAPMATLFEVWIHEKLWAAIQTDDSAVASRLRSVLVTLTTVRLLVSAAVPAVKESHKIEEKSVLGQIIGFAERQGSLDEGHLKQQFEKSPSMGFVDAYFQNAWRLVSIAGKVEEEELPE